MSTVQFTDALGNRESRLCPELTIVVPTFNERDNVELLVERLRSTLRGVEWEVIFVDDNSPDGTAAVAKAIGQRDGRVRCLRRINRRGLAGACIEGVQASQALHVCVMDADLQHDETLVVRMLESLRSDRCDLVVASRYAASGSLGEWSKARARLSLTGTRLARRLLRVGLSDPLSGFFAMRREAFDAVADGLSPDGFKILLEIVTSGGHLRIEELPFTLRSRLHGESKLDARVAFDFAALLASRLTANLVPPRLLLFCAIGLGGVFVHLAALQALKTAGLDFAHAQGFAALAAIASNFWLNNNLTYRAQRLRGIDAWKGLAVFALICSFGFVSNISIADHIFVRDDTWWGAGIAGALVSAVWNYAVSAALVWRR